MRHTRSIVLLAALLPLGLGGCNLFGGDESADVATTPTPVTVPTEPVAQAPAVAPDGTAQAPANAPTGPAGILPPDLISSTNPAQRVQSVQRNRPDPFALIPTTPTVEIPPSPASQPVPQLPNLPTQTVASGSPNRSTAAGGGSQPTASRPSTSQAGRPSGGTLAPVPNVPSISNPIAVAPLPPQPTLAQAVKVTGVVQIGSTLHAIVSAPNEPSSRYVRVGQRLSNGQVLVKRIEMNRGSEPVVILEENGVEVSTAVGAGGAPTDDAA